MSAPVASGTRSPFKASSEISACGWRAEPGGHQQRAELVAVQRCRVPSPAFFAGGVSATVLVTGVRRVECAARSGACRHIRQARETGHT